MAKTPLRSPMKGTTIAKPQTPSVGGNTRPLNENGPLRSASRGTKQGK